MSLETNGLGELSTITHFFQTSKVGINLSNFRFLQHRHLISLGSTERKKPHSGDTSSVLDFRMRWMMHRKCLFFSAITREPQM